MEIYEGSERAGTMHFLDNEPETGGAGKRAEIGENTDKPVSDKNTRRKIMVDITALIRSVQRVEGNPDCFKKRKDTCRELHCEWRAYCLEGPETPE